MNFIINLPSPKEIQFTNISWKIFNAKIISGKVKLYMTLRFSVQEHSMCFHSFIQTHIHRLYIFLHNRCPMCSLFFLGKWNCLNHIIFSNADSDFIIWSHLEFFYCLELLHQFVFSHFPHTQFCHRQIGINSFQLLSF